jgi:hypothetical protein
MSGDARKAATTFIDFKNIYMRIVQILLKASSSKMQNNEFTTMLTKMHIW